MERTETAPGSIQPYQVQGTHPHGGREASEGSQGEEKVSPGTKCLRPVSGLSTEARSEQWGSLGWGCFSVVHPPQSFPPRALYMGTQPLAGSPFPVNAVRATLCVWNLSLSGSSQSTCGESAWYPCCQQQPNLGLLGVTRSIK